MMIDRRKAHRNAKYEKKYEKIMRKRRNGIKMA